MNHLLVAPIVIPALAGALLVMLHRRSLATARAVSVAATAAFLACVVAMFQDAAAGAVPRVYSLGNWPAPFGIVLVADRLAAWMLLLTGVLASAVLLYAVWGWDARGRFFHAFLQFQVMGLAGAFLTGDLFNLFVFFEVMLIASYCLMLQGLSEARLRATLHYVAINVTASGVFLVAVSLLYGVTGTLNMAHLAERMAELAPDDAVLARVAGLLLIGVFCVKAALFPLYFWLPRGYANAAAPVAALFSIMTKVGVYSIVRVTTIVYGGGDDRPIDLISPWLLPLALTTLVVGTLGAFGAERLARMVAYLTVASVGTMLTAISAGATQGLAAGIYYLAHSTLVLAILFLLADLLGRQRGALRDVLHAGPRLAQGAALGLAFLAAGATVAGLPPSSGFLGKLMVLQSVQSTARMAVWTVILATSFLTILACVRAGSILLWNVADPLQLRSHAPRVGEWCAVLGLGACSLMLVIFAAPLREYAEAAASELASPRTYVEAVLGPVRTDHLRPLPGSRAP